MINIEIEDIINIADLKAWIIKYFIDNSLKCLLKKIMNGINVIKFNSKIIQIENQELQEIDNNGDKIIMGMM